MWNVLKYWLKYFNIGVIFIWGGAQGGLGGQFIGADGGDIPPRRQTRTLGRTITRTNRSNVKKGQVAQIWFPLFWAVLTVVICVNSCYMCLFYIDRSSPFWLKTIATDYFAHPMAAPLPIYIRRFGIRSFDTWPRTPGVRGAQECHPQNTN